WEAHGKHGRQFRGPSAAACGGPFFDRLPHCTVLITAIALSGSRLDAVVAVSGRAKFVPVTRHPRAAIKRGDVGGGAALGLVTARNFSNFPPRLRLQPDSPFKRSLASSPPATAPQPCAGSC